MVTKTLLVQCFVSAGFEAQSFGRWGQLFRMGHTGG